MFLVIIAVCLTKLSDLTAVYSHYVARIFLQKFLISAYKNDKQ